MSGFIPGANTAGLLAYIAFFQPPNSLISATQNALGFTLTQNAAGDYTITHNLNLSVDYAVFLCPLSASSGSNFIGKVSTYDANTVSIEFTDETGTGVDPDLFSFQLVPLLTP